MQDRQIGSEETKDIVLSYDAKLFRYLEPFGHDLRDECDGRMDGRTNRQTDILMINCALNYIARPATFVIFILDVILSCFNCS